MNVNAGAPAPSSSLPEPPYIFEKGTLLTAEVDWNKNSLQEFLPNNIELGDIVGGGIDVFFTRHNKPLTKINYVLIWIKKSNNEKVLIFNSCYVNYNDSKIGEALIKVLEKNGWITKEVNNKDKRMVNLHLTEKGQKMRNKSREYVIEFNKKIYDEINIDDLETCFRVLNKVNTIIDSKNIFK